MDTLEYDYRIAMKLALSLYKSNILKYCTEKNGTHRICLMEIQYSNRVYIILS